MKRLLQKGDIIYLKKNTRVYANIPELFIYENSKLSKRCVEAIVRIGNLYKKLKPTSSEIILVQTNIAKIFNNELGIEIIDFDDVENFVNSQINKYTPDLNQFIIKEGDFIVTHTTEDGGEPSHLENHYPNGYHVFCEKLTTREIKVNFYQTGCFTAMIEPDELNLKKKG